MKVLVIIPARGGSKGVPGKNIKLLGGKPLIAHAIDCAKTSKTVCKIVVSTDSEEISEIAVSYGATVVMRPGELADDKANVTAAVEHVLSKLNEDFEVIVLLQPTSPLRTSKDLDRIVSLFEQKEVENVISVVPFDDYHPARMYNLGSDDSLFSFIGAKETSRRQDLKTVYYRNGCFYAIRTSAFLKEKSMMIKNKKAYVMDANWLANIDSIRDFKIAELLYKDWQDENNSHRV